MLKATIQAIHPSHPIRPTSAIRLAPSTLYGLAEEERNSKAALAYPSQACQPGMSPTLAPATVKPSSAMARKTWLKPNKTLLKPHRPATEPRSWVGSLRDAKPQRLDTHERGVLHEHAGKSHQGPCSRPRSATPQHREQSGGEHRGAQPRGRTNH